MNYSIGVQVLAVLLINFHSTRVRYLHAFGKIYSVRVAVYIIAIYYSE